MTAASVKVVGQCDNVCPICLGPYKDPVAGRCGHLLCHSCQMMLQKQECPVCKQPLGDVRQIYGINLAEDTEEAQQIQS